MKVDPLLPENHDRPLCCIYGAQTFPTVFCCKIMQHRDEDPVIWGFSVYRREPGFRTLGQNLTNWMDGLREKYGWQMFEFYDSHPEAMARMAELTDPWLKVRRRVSYEYPSQGEQQ